MESEPNVDVVAEQYQKWVYPSPIIDLTAAEHRGIRNHADFVDRFYTFWPTEKPREDMDVLFAGCGTVSAAICAFNHPKARVVGVDLSAASLAHAARLKEKHSLTNLSLHQGRLEDVASLGRDFDFIEACGVLHHLPDPVLGLKALRGVLRPHGTAAIMVYAPYGRTGVYMAQEMFRLMGLGQTEADVAVVKETLGLLPAHHPVAGWTSRSADMKFDGGIVDTFLHRQDRAYSVGQCLDLTAGADMRFMTWIENVLYYPEPLIDPNIPLFKRVSAMPTPAIWQFMELYRGTIASHFFCAAGPGRPAADYQIDFSTRAFMDYVPVRRAREITPSEPLPAGFIVIARPPLPACTIAGGSAALFRQIDGKTSISDCFDRAGLHGAHDKETLCRDTFRHLWRVGYALLRIVSA